MIEARDFVDACLKREFTVWSGVPCPLLGSLIHSAEHSRNIDYVAATSEREATAIAAGAFLGGRIGVVLCQNSGLGGVIDPVASLAFPYRIPMLIILTRRGSEALEDGVQHEMMGRITGDLLLRARVGWEAFPEQRDEIDGALTRALESMESSGLSMESSGLPYALVMDRPLVIDHPRAADSEPKRSPRTEPLGCFENDPADRMSRLTAIRTVRDALSGAEALIATAGKTCRDLFSLGHRSNQFYVLGAMGSASSIALGIQRARRDRDVVVLDGDGAALMGFGSLATIGHYGPRRFTHVLLDNEVHASTGGQPTVSPNVDFAAVAAACGYRNAWSTDDGRELAERVREASRTPGPSFIHVKISAVEASESNAPSLTPHQMKAQFMDWIQGL